MAEFRFSAIISVLDRATAPLRQINRQIAAATSPVRQIGARLAALSEESGLTKVGEAAVGVGRSFGNLASQVGGLLGPLAALGGAASVAGLVEMARKASEFGANLFDVSRKIGISGQALAQYRYAAELAGVASDSLDSGMEKLNRTIGAAAVGQNKQALALFGHLGISIRDASGHLKSASDILPHLADAFAKTRDPAMRAEMAVLLFGRAGQDLLPLLDQGRERLAAMAQEARDLGIAMSDKDIAAAKESEDAWKRLSFAVQGLSNTIGSALFPLITPLLDQMKTWIAANRTLIAGKVKEFVTGVAEALKKIDWAAIGSGAASIASGFGSLMSSTTGQVGVFTALSGVIAGPFLLALAGCAKSLVELGIAIGGVAVKLGLLAFAQVAGAVGNFVTALKAGYGAMQALNLVMDANPIGLVILAVTALAAAAYLIYRNWGPISAWFEDLWAKVKSGWDRVAGWGKEFSTLIGTRVTGPIEDAWSGVAKFFSDLWAGIVAKFQWALDQIKPIIDAVSGAVKSVTDALSFGGGDQPALAGAGAGRFQGGSRFGRPAVPLPSIAGQGYAPQGRTGPVTVNNSITVNRAGPDTTVSTATTSQGSPVVTRKLGYNMPHDATY